MATGSSSSSSRELAWLGGELRGSSMHIRRRRANIMPFVHGRSMFCCPTGSEYVDGRH